MFLFNSFVNVLILDGLFNIPFIPVSASNSGLTISNSPPLYGDLLPYLYWQSFFIFYAPVAGINTYSLYTGATYVLSLTSPPSAYFFQSQYFSQGLFSLAYLYCCILYLNASRSIIIYFSFHFQMTSCHLSFHHMP